MSNSPKGKGFLPKGKGAEALTAFHVHVPNYP